MGCWKGTCGVTQLPIRWEDPIRLFILEPNNYFGTLTNKLADKETSCGNIGGGFCYAGEIFSPFGPALIGKCNDQGNAEEIVNNTNAKIVVDYFNKNKKKIFNESDDYYPKESKVRGKYTIEGICKMVERGLTTKGIMLVHEFAYQALIQDIKPDREYWWGYAEPMQDFINDISYGRDKVKSAKNKYSKFKNKKYEKMTKEEKEIFSLGGPFSDTDPGSERKGKGYKRNLVWPCNGEGDAKINYLTHSLVYKNYVIESKRLTKEFIENYAEHFKFATNFSLMRKFWIPQAGAGSQYGKLDMYKNLTNATQSYILEIEQRDTEDL